MGLLRPSPPLPTQSTPYNILILTKLQQTNTHQKHFNQIKMHEKKKTTKQTTT